MKKVLFTICLLLLLVNVLCTNTSESVKKGTIDITVDTKNVTVEKVDNAYLPKKCKLVVNGEEIDSKKYTIEDKTITYKIDDPNWLDFI